MRLSLFVPAALLSLLPLACGGSDSEATDPSQQNQYNAGQYQGGQPQGGAYGQQQGYPQQGYPQQGAYPQQTTPGVGAGAGVGLPGTTAPASGSSAQPVAPGMTAFATPIITGIAQQQVQGMQPVGQAFAGQFAEGQTLEQTFNIDAGKCYAVIGVGGPGIQELDVQIVATPPAPLPAQVLSQDSTTGANATLGGGGACFKNPFPIGGPGKVVLKATRGAGLAAAQIYVK